MPDVQAKSLESSWMPLFFSDLRGVLLVPSSNMGHTGWIHGLAPESTCFSPAPQLPQPSLLPASLADFIAGTLLLVLLSPSLPIIDYFTRNSQCDHRKACPISSLLH